MESINTEDFIPEVEAWPACGVQLVNNMATEL
jgi:hypothetical protein